MPTFQSIPIHSSVKSRLLESYISTPRSLLTRDPKDLVQLFSRGEFGNDEEQKKILLGNMEKIRCQVAHEMIAKTQNGKRILNQRQNNQQPSMVQGGSLTAMQTWDLHQKSLSNMRRPQAFSTGCRALDELIGFPTDLIARYSCNTNYNEDSTEIQGLRGGYVLQLTGTIGKTQLALQIASQVIRQSSMVNSCRIRYCFSTAGHSSCSLAHRFFQLQGNGSERLTEDDAKKIEFQPIAKLSQLVSTVAKIEEELLSFPNDASSNQTRVEQEQSVCRYKNPVSVLILDTLPLMLVESDGIDRIRSLERRLKRLARHHMVLVVITGVGAINSLSPDIHLKIQKLTSTTSSVRLIRHPEKFVTENDCITLLHSSKFGLSSPE